MGSVPKMRVQGEASLRPSCHSRLPLSPMQADRPEEGREILFGQLERPARIGVEEGLGHRALARLQLEDRLLHRSLDDEAVDEDRAGLDASRSKPSSSRPSGPTGNASTIERISGARSSRSSPASSVSATELQPGAPASSCRRPARIANGSSCRR